MASEKVIVVGGGLAGVESAWALANRGMRVELYEARPKWKSPAHKTEFLAELVCSNSLKSEETGHATALLKEEMKALGSLVIEAAHKTKVPAGKALAVDRDEFAKYITDKISTHPNIKVVREEVCSLKACFDESGRASSAATIIATGPLTSPKLTDSLQPLLNDKLYFYDSIAPIVTADSINMQIAYKASRYDVGKNEEGDYINCPLNKEQYYNFVDALLKSEQIQVHEFDEIKCFEGCMPIEVMASRHKDALKFGPMKPIGLTDPHTGVMPYAVVQLRQDNLHATLFNMVGFQTRMTYSEQEIVFRTIPSLENAKFERLGSMHRNTYINGPELLDDKLQLKSNPGIYIAGQLTGVEGYLESAATGLYVGLTIASSHRRAAPTTTAIGSLINHVINSDPKHYQPMKIMWGIFPPLAGFESTKKGPPKDKRREMLLKRAREDFVRWQGSGVALAQ